MISPEPAQLENSNPAHDLCQFTKSFPNFQFSISVKVCQKRWKALRERFGIYFKRFVKTNETPNWKYYESLEYLKPYISLKEKEEEEFDHSSFKKTGDFSTDLLIQLVREHEIIYDKSHKFFRSSVERRKIWHFIGDQIGQSGKCN